MNKGKLIRKGFEYEYFVECKEGDIIRDGRKLRKCTGFCPAIYEKDIDDQYASEWDSEINSMLNVNFI